MTRQLKVSIGQYSDKGRKEINQDFHGALVPKEPQLGAKGVAIVLADGISSSSVSQIASEAAVTSFLEDYYCTSDAWSVKTSAERVLSATNSWLHSQTQQSHYRFDKDRGYVCTLSALVIKSTTAHIFHVGDSRIYRLRGDVLEQLTQDHRVWVSQSQSHLGRALGIDSRIDIDYRQVPVVPNDVFLLTTDGVHEYAQASFITRVLKDSGTALDEAAHQIGAQAYEKGSGDNLTVQIVKVLALPAPQANEMYRQISELPLAPLLLTMFPLDELLQRVLGVLF